MNNCPNCAPYDCYHICPNSEHYYSPEQERYDDQFYGDDDNRERYAATLASMEHECDIADEMEAAADPFTSHFTWDTEHAVQQRAVDFPDDIPF